MDLALPSPDASRLPLDALKLASLLEALAQRTLDSPELPCPAQSPLAELPLETAGALPLGEGLAFNLAAGTRLRLDAFNSPDDTDDGKVLQAGAPGPLPLPFGGERCYLRTQLQGHLKCTLAQGLKGAGLDLEGQLLLGDYRARKGSDRVRDALQATLQAPRTLFRLEDLEALGEGDALSLRALGTLGATLELDWSTLLANRWSALSELLGAGELAALQVTRGFSASLALGLQDEFQITLARSAGAGFALEVRKPSRRTLGLGATLGVQAAFTDPKGVEEALDTLLDQGLLGPVRKELEALRQAATLSPEQQAALGRILNLLGLRDPRPALEEVAHRLDQLQTELKAKAQELAQAQAALAFRAEYNALEEGQTVLTALLDRDLLHKHHAALLGGHLEALLQDLRAGRGQLLSFLDRRSEERAASWGFTLGLGRWKLGGQDQFQERRSEVRNPREAVRASQRAVRSYDSRWMGEENAWFLDLKADMDGFSGGSAPALGEYAYGLHLLNRRRAPLSLGGAEDLLDRAVAWDILPQGSLEAARAQLQGFLASSGLEGQPVEAILQARLEDGPFRAFLDSMAQATLADLGQPLAAAMPRWEACDGGRLVPLRRRIYGPLWAGVLSEPHPDPLRIAQGACSFLTRAGERDLANRERRYLLRSATGPDWNAFGGLVALFPGTRETFQTFLEACRQLRQGLQDGSLDQRDSLRDRFRDLSRPGAQSFHLWALGVLLSDRARVAGFPVERSLTVRGTDQPEKTFLLTGTHGA